ncbi:hypothetical protein ES703_124163 [subsurface metagenome]
MTLQWVMIIIVGVGVMATGASQIRLWIKNGREAARRDGILDTKLEGISLTQTETRQDIANLSDSINEQKQHCASVTGVFAEQIKTLQKDK